MTSSTEFRMKLPTTTIATDMEIASSENDVFTGCRSSCRSTMRATFGTKPPKPMRSRIVGR